MGYSPWGPKRIRRDLATKQPQLSRHMKALESATHTRSFGFSLCHLNLWPMTPLISQELG